uniref:P/Homo B domain-containing protein n=1 Tax=Clastoptera arizonana TaxID=38151 RepID=A0A1B6E0T0_9HEMI
MILRLVILAYFGYFMADATHLNMWVAHIPEGVETAKRVARDLGYEYIRPLKSFDDHFYFKKIDHPERSKRESAHLTMELAQHEKVEWVSQQTPTVREKRAYKGYARKRPTTTTTTPAPKTSDGGMYSWMASNYDGMFNDPLWSKQWYCNDYRTSSRKPVSDLNVVPLYQAGFTGQGVKLAVIDDGLEIDHPDLVNNYDASISYDFNEDDDDPTPRDDDGSGSNSHGTRCGGEIVMQANNSICGVGIAYNAKVGGIKILDGVTSDALEGEALAYMCKNVDIYVSSWGPPDDAKTLEYPGEIVTKGLLKGITKGRNGLGSIFTFASGNGKHYGDNCACDGFVQSIYTIAIASASQSGKTTYYGERCSAIMATTYSSGNKGEEQVASVDLHGKCTVSHTGTSAAAPIAAGIIALILEVNPNLGWRDVQHLLAATSEVYPLSKNSGWMKNGFGFYVSPDFGFGLMNAYNMAAMAQNWVNVPDQKKCQLSIGLSSPLELTTGEIVSFQFETEACAGTVNEVKYLEHVQVKFDADVPYRGAVVIDITSPSGTKTRILDSRAPDFSTVGFKGWTLTSLHQWGENPTGTWTLDIKLQDISGIDKGTGTADNFVFTFWGTSDMPNHYQNFPRSYDSFNLQV